MREIKFRAWDHEQKKWAEFVAIKDSRDTYYDEFGTLIISTLDARYTIQLFTNLKDKNNKEIYEGDIVDGSSRPGSFPSRYGVVRWVDAGLRFSWLLEWKDGEKVPKYEDPMYYNALGDNTRQLEVIGNIYENPELLPDSK